MHLYICPFTVTVSFNNNNLKTSIFTYRRRRRQIAIRTSTRIIEQNSNVDVKTEESQSSKLDEPTKHVIKEDISKTVDEYLPLKRASKIEEADNLPLKRIAKKVRRERYVNRKRKSSKVEEDPSEKILKRKKIR